MTGTITLELCAEDRARLDRLAAALESAARKEAPDAVTGLPEVKTEEQEVKTDVPWETKAADPEPKTEEKTVTMDDLKALVQELAAPNTGKFEQVKRIVKHFATKVSQIEEADWPACYEMLMALKEA